MADEPVAEPEKEKDTTNVSFACPNELYALLEKEAKEEDRNISQQVRRIVRKYYEAKQSA